MSVALAPDLTWQTPIATPEKIVTLGSPGDVSLSIVPILEHASSLEFCVRSHVDLIAQQSKAHNWVTSEPKMAREKINDHPIFRVSFAVETAQDGKTFAVSWTYAMIGDKCLGVNVTSVVRADPKTPDQPNLEDISRQQHVVQVVIDGLVQGGP
jgi:hypothetical protein